MLLLLGIVAIVIGIERARSARARSSRRWHAWLAVPLAGAVLVALGAPRGLLLTKSIGLLVMPLGLGWIALFVLSLVALAKHRWRDAVIAGSLFVALSLAGNEPLGDALDGWIEGEHASANPFAAGHFDAIIVLGGGTDARPGGGVQLGTSGDRVILAARLYHAGATPLLVTSGSPIRGLTTHDAAAATAQIWRHLAIPERAIVVIDGARTTSEEAHLHARWIRRRALSRVGLVTSAAHMRRALELFEAEGAHVVPLPADVHARPFDWHGFYSVIPQGRAAWRIHSAFWEMVGRLAGR